MRMEGPEYVTGEEVLRLSLAREDKLQRTAWELDGRASELERERDEAWESAAASRRSYEEMEEAYRKKIAERGETRRLAIRLGLVAAALLVISILVTWRLFT